MPAKAAIDDQHGDDGDATARPAALEPAARAAPSSDRWGGIGGTGSVMGPPRGARRRGGRRRTRSPRRSRWRCRRPRGRPRAPGRDDPVDASSCAAGLRRRGSARELIIGVPQSSGAVRSSLACARGDRRRRDCPRRRGCSVTTAATSSSERICAKGGMPYGIGLPAVPGG